MINTILIVASAALFAIILFVLYSRAKMKTAEISEEDYSTMQQVLEAVKQEMVEIVKEDYSLGLSDSEFNALYKRKARINDALKNCVHGIDSAKVIVIELIRGFIADHVPHERVTELLGLSEGMDPSDHTKFEILMYRYKKEHGKKALGKLIDKYDLARERQSSDGDKATDKSYFVTIEDLHTVYEKESIHLSMDEQIDVLAVLVYQSYKGFGILDTLREMDINGFNCGTSGSIMNNVKSQQDGTLKATNSLWLYYQGKYIHLRFMNFGSEDELKRIIQLLIRFGNPGPLTAKRGYLVNTMYDKSRILALRPPASEYWAVFVRKFTVDDPSPKALICKPNVTRGDLAVSTIEYLIRGNVTCGVTGRQGSGKTTLMAAIFRFINPRYTLRVLEMAPELYLRELYPSRNILSVQETEYVTPSELQDALKKSDAAVSIVGEVATDAIAARMIQMGQVASIFTIFSHHANTPKDLVYALRNSLVNAGGFSDMNTAEKQVTDVIKIDIHLDYTPDGTRFVERISEIIPLEENLPYPDYDPQKPDSINSITREYYTRRTDRISFYTRDILKYDKDTKTYLVGDRISPELEHRIRSNLGELREDYDKFVFSEWGLREFEADGQEDEVYESILEMYGDLTDYKKRLKALEGLKRKLKLYEQFEDNLNEQQSQEYKQLLEEIEAVKLELSHIENHRKPLLNKGKSFKELDVEEQMKLVREIMREEEAAKRIGPASGDEEAEELSSEDMEDEMLFFDFFDGGELVK